MSGKLERHAGNIANPVHPVIAQRLEVAELTLSADPAMDLDRCGYAEVCSIIDRAGEDSRANIILVPDLVT
jgi:hypothetical protein